MNNKEKYHLIKIAVGGYPQNWPISPFEAHPSAAAQKSDGGVGLDRAAQLLTGAAGSGLGMASKGLRLAGNVGKSFAGSVGAQSGRQFAKGPKLDAVPPSTKPVQGAMKKFMSPLMAAPMLSGSGAIKKKIPSLMEQKYGTKDTQQSGGRN